MVYLDQGVYSVNFRVRLATLFIYLIDFLLFIYVNFSFEDIYVYLSAFLSIFESFYKN